MLINYNYRQYNKKLPSSTMLYVVHFDKIKDWKFETQRDSRCYKLFGKMSSNSKFVLPTKNSLTPSKLLTNDK